MGLVQSVKQRRKKQKIQNSRTPEGESTSADYDDPTSSTSSYTNEIYYTMVGHARGPNVPIGILTSLSKDMVERSKRHHETLQRIESLQSLLSQIESSATSSSSCNPPVALLAAHLRETKKENPQFLASHALYQTLWDLTVSKNKA